MGNLCDFPYFSRTMEIHFSHVLGIVSISALPKIFEKPITLECLFFSILVPYYENSLFPCFGNCLDNCFTQTHKFEMFVFSHAFLIPWKSFFFHILENAWISYEKFKKPLALKFVFPYFSLTMGIHFSYILEILWISTSPEIFKKPINLKCLCFPILVLYYGNPLSPYFEFRELYGFLFIEKYVRKIWPWNVLFSHTLPVLSEFTFPMFWG